MSSNKPLATTVDHLFVGGVARLPNGQDSAIYKRASADRLSLDDNGVTGDVQSDRDNHGGPDRALHQYPAEHIEHWRQAFKDEAFVPGVFGENISTQGMTESDVHVGDVFSLGTAVLQLAQPRQPCWKPGERLSHKTMARDLVSHGRAGWFFRVLQAGEIAAGDILRRTETAEHGISLARFWQLANDREPNTAARESIAFLIDYEALAQEWRTRFKRRLD